MENEEKTTVEEVESVSMKIQGELTPKFLREDLSPFLDALEGLQGTIDEIKGVVATHVSIRGISSEKSILVKIPLDSLPPLIRFSDFGEAGISIAILSGILEDRKLPLSSKQLMAGDKKRGKR